MDVTIFMLDLMYLSHILGRSERQKWSELVQKTVFDLVSPHPTEEVFFFGS
jgi:hypothetical protein